MNKIILMGRLTADPKVRYGGAQNICIAQFSIAVDRRYKKEGQPKADFFNCVSFGKQGEFVEKYLHKGIKILLEGELQNNNYENPKHPGEMVYGMQVLANQIEFAESKKAQQDNGTYTEPGAGTGNAGSGNNGDDFVNVDQAMADDLPFA